MTDTSKFTVTQEMTDAFYSKAEVTSIGTILNLEAAIEAMLAAAPEQKPVAYAAFAKNGNIRIWSQEPGRIDATAAVDGFEVKPLYTHPVQNDITDLRSLLEQAEKEREELKDALATELGEVADHLGSEYDSISILHTVREIEADRDIYKSRAEAAEKALADVRNERDAMRQKAIDNARERNAAEAKLKEAVEVIRPFATRAEMLDGIWRDHETQWSPESGDRAITIGNLRAASAFLAKVSP